MDPAPIKNLLFSNQDGAIRYISGLLKTTNTANSSQTYWFLTPPQNLKIINKQTAKQQRSMN